jgi:hypothetical protein
MAHVNIKKRMDFQILDVVEPIPHALQIHVVDLSLLWIIIFQVISCM